MAQLMFRIRTAASGHASNVKPDVPEYVVAIMNKALARRSKTGWNGYAMAEQYGGVRPAC